MVVGGVQPGRDVERDRAAADEAPTRPCTGSGACAPSPRSGRRPSTPRASPTPSGGEHDHPRLARASEAERAARARLLLRAARSRRRSPGRRARACPQLSPYVIVTVLPLGEREPGDRDRPPRHRQPARARSREARRCCCVVEGGSSRGARGARRVPSCVPPGAAVYVKETVDVLRAVRDRRRRGADRPAPVRREPEAAHRHRHRRVGGACRRRAAPCAFEPQHVVEPPCEERARVVEAGRDRGDAAAEPGDRDRRRAVGRCRRCRAARRGSRPSSRRAPVERARTCRCRPALIAVACAKARRPGPGSSCRSAAVPELALDVPAPALNRAGVEQRARVRVSGRDRRRAAAEPGHRLPVSDCRAVFPSPSSPFAFAPQHSTAPSCSSAHVCARPAASARRAESRR